MIRVVGFDIGVRNLAYSVMTYNNGIASLEKIEVIDLDPPKRCKKCDCKASMKFNDETYWCKRHCPEGSVAWKKPKKQWDMFKLAKTLFNELDNRPWLVKDIDVVALENQPVTINPHIKSVQVLIFGYFVRCGVPDVKSVSAAHKYKVVLGAKAKNIPKDYKIRKLMAIEHANSIIRKIDSKDCQEVMNKCRKKDDVADAILINGRWAQQKGFWSPEELFQL